MHLPLPLGEIRVIEVLEYYDEPVLYFGESLTGQKYLVMLARDESEERHWLLAPLSSVRHASLREGSLDLYSAFVRVEGGVVWRARQKRSRSESLTIEHVNAAALDDSELPDPGFFAESFTLPTHEQLPEVTSIARGCQRDVVMLHMLPRSRSTHEVPLAALGRASLGTQGVLYALEAHLAGRVGKRGQYTKQIIDDAELVAAATHAASFAVELKSTATADLFGTTTVSASLLALFELLDAVQTDEGLRAALPRFAGTRVPSKLRELLGSIVEQVPAVEFVWGYLAVVHNLFGKVATKQALAELYAIAEQLPDGDRRDDVMSDLATICDHYGIEQDQLP